MTAWYEGALVGFDLETTGVDPFSDHIIQIGIDFSIMHDGVQVADEAQSFERLVDPSIDIPNSEIHGITDEMVGGAMGEDDGIVELATYLRQIVIAKIPIVIFNAQFDWTFLRVRMEKLGMKWNLDDARIIDPLVCDRHFDKYRKGKGMRKQGKVAGIYGLPENLDAHTARADAAECVAIARAMARKYPALRSGSELNQESWALDQQMSLQRYFDKSAQTNDDGSKIIIETGWPLRSHEGWGHMPAVENSGLVVKDTMLSEETYRKDTKIEGKLKWHTD